jgi:hypothetical protein
MGQVLGSLDGAPLMSYGISPVRLGRDITVV